MSQLLLEVLSILTEPSGDLIFHLVQIFSALAALLLALSSHQDSKSTVYRRFLLGILVVLGSQLLLFLIATFGLRGFFDTHLILPIFDRTINCLCMIWIIWLWVAPEPWKVADYTLIGSNIVVGVSFLVTCFTWFVQGSGQNFNSTWQDLLWADLMVLAIVVGLIGLIYKKPDGWGIGVGFLAINLTGLIAHLAYSTQPGDYAGIVRLVQIFTYPLLPVLTRRFSVVPAPPPAPISQPIPPGPSERTRFTAESRTIDTWLQLSAQERSEPFRKLLVKAIAQTMVADICLLISIPDSQNQVRVFSGYDLIRQESFGGGTIKGENIPEIMRAFSQNLPLIMPTGGSISKDLKTLRDVLNLKAPSNSMFIPILYHQEPIAGMLLCTPYSTRVWDITDESYLYSVTNRVGALLAEIMKREENLESDDLSNLDEEGMREKYSLLKQENIALVTEIDVLQEAPELPVELSSPAPEPQAVIALPAITSTAAAQGNGSMEEENLRTELRIALEELSRLKAAQGVAENAAASSQAQQSGEQKEPQSVQFELDQVSSAARIEKESQGSDNFTSREESADVILEAAQFVEAVDQAIRENREGLAEKRIALLSDIPDSLPIIKAAPSLFRKLVGHTLRNVIYLSLDDQPVHLKVILNRKSVILRFSFSIPALEGDSHAPAPSGFPEQEWTMLIREMEGIQGSVSVEKPSAGSQSISLHFEQASLE